MCQFTLRPDALEWQIGRRSGRLRYDRVRAVRLSYRPVTMQSHRFITEIWSADNPKIQIVSVSWRSIMEQERLDKAYSAFVTELHRRVAARGRRGEVLDRPAGRDLLGRRRHLQRGHSRDRRAVRARDELRAMGARRRSSRCSFWCSAYQLGTYFYRNRPGRYRPDAIPPGVLPKI